VLAAQLNDRDARLVFLQHIDDLLLAEPSLARSSVSSRRILAAKRGRSRGQRHFVPVFRHTFMNAIGPRIKATNWQDVFPSSKSTGYAYPWEDIELKA